MGNSCNHKDRNGNSLIEDGSCSRCKIEFGAKFLKKQKEKEKKKTHQKIEELEI